MPLVTKRTKQVPCNTALAEQAARGTEFPTCLLQVILQHLRSDLLSLLAVCCVSKEWKAAAEDLPELWMEIWVPECLRNKLTDERLGYILAKGKGQGLIDVQLFRCKYITDESVRAIERNLLWLPNWLCFDHCAKVTWRSVIPLAKHILKLLKEKEERHSRSPHCKPLRDF